MQAIAREMKAPGTAFVSASPRPDADYGLRKFTPTREVAYSGHTTLGAVRTLLDAGRLSGERVVFATRAGRPARGNRGARGRPPCSGSSLRCPSCAALRRVASPTSSPRWAWPSRGSVDGRGRPSRRTPDLLLPGRRPRRAAGARARPRDASARSARRSGCARSASSRRETVEPSSGGALALLRAAVRHPRGHRDGLGALLPRRLAPRGGAPARAPTASRRFTAEQGDVLGRPGRLAVEVHTSSGRASRVRVGGRAVTVLTGRLRLP